MIQQTEQPQALTEPHAIAVDAAPDQGAFDPRRVRVAGRSTGPRTTAGKAIAARNSIGHGIYAKSPVIEGVESAEEWNVYRQAMLSCLDPVGMLEETLSERCILMAWRLRRVVTFETRKIQRPMRYEADDHAGKDQERRRELKFLKWFETAGDAECVSKTATRWLVQYARKMFRAVDDGVPDGESDGADMDDQKQSQVNDCTVGRIRERLGCLAERHGTTIAGVLHMLQQDITKKQEDAQRQLAVDCSVHLVPEENVQVQVIRYESHLERLFHRDLHELERLQARRSGQPVAAPFVMDINLANLPNDPPPSCNT